MSTTIDHKGILSDSTATLARVIRAVDQAEAELDVTPNLSFGVSSNVSADLVSLFLRKHALLHGKRLNCEVGGHDDVLNDVSRFAEAGVKNMLYIPFFDNLVPNFETRIDSFFDQDIEAIHSDFIMRTKLMFEKAKTMSMVYVSTFHLYDFAVDAGANDRRKMVLNVFNAKLRDLASGFPNVRLLDVGTILQTISTEKAFDRRFYFLNTAPYRPVFLDELARCIALASRGFGTYFYKALVLDCDNTLWGGVIGEDLMDGIKLDPHSFPGRVFWQAQQAFLGLERSGTLLCLCSKNNPEDVDQVLTSYPNQVLKDEQFILKKVNWQPKVENLKAIAQELNIGLDSLVFVDDSSFECESVRAALPQVRVVQVPSSLQHYPKTIQEIRELFIAAGIMDESRSKTNQYTKILKASAGSADFDSHDDYLRTLDLQVTLDRNSPKDIPRISELSMKSNQFNLTTLRQDVGDITRRMASSDNRVYSLKVSDRFGEAGLTGVAIVSWEDEIATVEAFLMSCRVIGRGVEFSIWSQIAKDVAEKGCRFLQASYLPSAKNLQVADFYDRLGLSRIASTDAGTYYMKPIDRFTPPTVDYIKVICGN